MGCKVSESERVIHRFKEAKKDLYMGYKCFLSTVALAADRFISRHHDVPDEVGLPDRLTNRLHDTDDKSMIDSAVVIARTAIESYRRYDMDLVTRLFANRLKKDDVGMFYDVVVDNDALKAFKMYVDYYLNKEDCNEQTQTDGT